MAISATGTKLANLVNPEVMGDMIRAELEKNIAFLPLADVDRTLVGRAGNTLTVPKYGYIGDATDVGEGEDIPISQMSTTTTEVTVKKAGKGIELSDEAVLSGYGDPLGEGTRQLGMSIGNAVDNDLGTQLKKATRSVAVGGAELTISSLFEGKAKFGEKINQPTVLIINSGQYAALANNITKIEHLDKVLMSGTIGEIAGLQVVISDKLKATEAFLVQAGALGLLLKRDLEVESDRDIVAKTTVVTADEHYAAYLKDETKVVKFTLTA